MLGRGVGTVVRARKGVRKGAKGGEGMKGGEGGDDVYQFRSAVCDGKFEVEEVEEEEEEEEVVEDEEPQEEKEVRRCEGRNDKLRKHVYWISTYTTDTSARYVVVTNSNTVSNVMNTIFSGGPRA
jgi:hypothetical protein